MKLMTINNKRADWIDAVKGITIILVVFHHALGGVNNSIGIEKSIYDIYLLSGPIRMPLFFLIAGLFARKSLFSNINTFIETKVFHFLYYYILWNTLSIFIRASLSSFTNNDYEYTQALYLFWEPGLTLWFLYSLLWAYCLARLLRGLGFLQHFIVALALYFIFRGVLIDEIPLFVANTFKLYPYFVFGIYQSEKIREWVTKATWPRVFTLFSLFLVGSVVRFYSADLLNDFIRNEVLHLVLSFISAGAVMSIVYIFTKHKPNKTLNYIGTHSLYIYLLHFLPAAGFRVLLLKTGLIEDKFLLIVITTILSVYFCILSYKIVLKIKKLNFLFVRPKLKFSFLNSNLQK